MIFLIPRHGFEVADDVDASSENGDILSDFETDAGLASDAIFT
jgi:hypothetical protein